MSFEDLFSATNGLTSFKLLYVSAVWTVADTIPHECNATAVHAHAVFASVLSVLQ